MSHDLSSEGEKGEPRVSTGRTVLRGTLRRVKNGLKRRGGGWPWTQLGGEKGDELTNKPNWGDLK